MAVNINFLYLYFELAVYLAVMNGHYILIGTENSPKYISRMYMFADLALVHIHIRKHKGFVVQYEQLTGLCATLYGIAQVPSYSSVQSSYRNYGYTSFD